MAVHSAVFFAVRGQFRVTMVSCAAGTPGATGAVMIEPNASKWRAWIGLRKRGLICVAAARAGDFHNRVGVGNWFAVDKVFERVDARWPRARVLNLERQEGRAVIARIAAAQLEKRPRICVHQAFQALVIVVSHVHGQRRGNERANADKEIEPIMTGTSVFGRLGRVEPHGADASAREGARKQPQRQANANAR
ncbi:MAG: hypothetical protein QM759_03595 [Terricaulis sp.]